MYKLHKSPMSAEIKVVFRKTDNSYIPFDPDNADYKAYLIWLEEGNTPEPAENL